MKHQITSAVITFISTFFATLGVLLSGIDASIVFTAEGFNAAAIVAIAVTALRTAFKALFPKY